MLIKRKFYNRNTIQVAKDLLGCFLVREYNGKIIKAMITETEAYRGEYDLACHASKGRTKRTEIMYGEPGHAYVYMIYGMYYMLNVITEEKDFPAAVLIRCVRVFGHPMSKEDSARGTSDVLSGPGRLTKYLHIGKSLNGCDLTVGKKLWLEKSLGHSMSKWKVIKSPRVGIDYARHCKSWKWNFKLKK